MTTGSGNTRSTSEHILWRDEADLGPRQLCAGPMGATIPVAFQIPLDAHPTEKISSSDEYVWVLAIPGSLPGVICQGLLLRPNTPATFVTESCLQSRP
jgi:hypothetical protein